MSRILPKADLLVVKGVDEGGEAPGLVLHGERQPGNVPNKHGVEVFRHFQVIAGTQGLGKTWDRSTGHRANWIYQGRESAAPLSGQHTTKSNN